MHVALFNYLEWTWSELTSTLSGAHSLSSDWNLWSEVADSLRSVYLIMFAWTLSDFRSFLWWIKIKWQLENWSLNICFLCRFRITSIYFAKHGTAYLQFWKSMFPVFEWCMLHRFLIIKFLAYNGYMLVYVVKMCIFFAVKIWCYHIHNINCYLSWSSIILVRYMPSFFEVNWTIYLEIFTKAKE